MLTHRRVCLVILLASVFFGANAWKWQCQEEENCVRIEESTNYTDLFNSVEVCRLVCGDQGPFWPIPHGTYEISKELITVHPDKFEFEVKAPESVANVLQESISIFKQNVLKECPECGPVEKTIQVKIKVQSDDMALNWSTNEAYTLNLKADGNCTITASTFFGARHGLETLSQLISGDSKNFHMIKSSKIEDKPIYPHRGLLLDSARNFISVPVIKRQIDGMASSKLNYLHWHISDSQSFPYESTREPLLTLYGATSKDRIYTPKDIEDLNHYALVNGVRIVMEIDAPAHAGNGWQWGPTKSLGDLAVCVNEQPWRQFCIEAPCGQLNPANENVYDVLENLFRDIADGFRTDIFHMGGDEIFFPCWNSSEQIVNYLAAKGKDQSLESFLHLWSEFQNKSLSRYDKVVGNSDSNIILWSSELTNPTGIENYLDKSRYIIQTWVPSTDSLPRQLLDKGYRLIISTKNAWYLDHGFWGVTKYYTWRTVYNNRLIAHRNVLGGEVCMWGEFIDEEALDGRIWPRAAAAGERLWASPVMNSEKAEARMFRHRERLVSRQIDAEALGPSWCYQNEGQCF